MKEIFLASASPRRQELLRQIGLPFTIMISDVTEEITVSEPEKAVQELALRKAKDVALQLQDGIVIGADTVVYGKGIILGKPLNQEDAEKMLRELSGCKHEVLTGLAIIEIQNGQIIKMQNDFERTAVYFKILSSSEITKYVATGEPMDKAGAYAIQGLGAVFVEKIEGCYFNVVGLPLFRLVENLQNFGISIFKA